MGRKNAGVAGAIVPVAPVLSFFFVAGGVRTGPSQ
jgi:hypothetical protein